MASSNTIRLTRIIFLASALLSFALAQTESNALKPLAEMGTYLKSHTQFDGVDSEEYVTFLKLHEHNQLQIPVLSTGHLQTPLDFTVMLWIKLDEKATA